MNGVKQHFLLKKKEEDCMSVILHNGHDALKAIFLSLPERIILHSKRVTSICEVLAKYIPTKFLPENMEEKCYNDAICDAGLYHEIGIFVARNNVEQRNKASKRLLESFGFNEIVLEGVYCFQERYDRKEKNIPFHAHILAIADRVDMIMGSGKFSKRKAKKATEFIMQNKEMLYNLDAVNCFKTAKEEIFELYQNEHEGLQNLCERRLCFERLQGFELI